MANTKSLKSRSFHDSIISFVKGTESILSPNNFDQHVKVWLDSYLKGVE